MTHNEVLRDLSAFAQGEEVTGTTVMTVPLVPSRKAHLMSFADRRALVLELDGEYRHWEPTEETLEAAAERACDWLTEPPSEIT